MHRIASHNVVPHYSWFVVMSVVEPVATAEIVVPAQVSSEAQLLRFAPPFSLLLAVSFFWFLPLAVLFVVEPPAVRLAESAAVRVVAQL